MKLKYVGLKERETAFQSETGVEWWPGIEHDIKDEALCARMLKHPDVFAVADETEPDSDTNPDTEQTKALFMQTAAGVLDLSKLTRDELHALAKESNITVHHKAKAETVAAKLAEAFPVKAE